MSTEINESKSILTIALEYAGFGWPVLPLHWSLGDGTCSCQKPDCSSVGKHPIINNGVKGATTDKQTINQWWTKNPRANLGIATGESSRATVFDIDVRHGGLESLAELERAHGNLPATWKVKTGSGGYHYYFKYPDVQINNRIGRLPGLDFKTNGGYVVAPPSIHACGGRYEWVVKEGEITDAPGWLLTLLSEKKSEITAISEEGDIPSGQRNDTLFSLACSFRSKGLNGPEIIQMLEIINHNRCKPPLSAQEISSIMLSATGYEPGSIVASWTKNYNHTDVGNAQRVVALHGSNFRYCHPWKKFLIWDGKRFAVDLTGEIDRLAKDTVRKMYSEASALEDESERKRQAKHSMASENQNRLKAMIDLAKTEPGVAVVPDDLDVDDWMLNCLNGTINLKTGELKPHLRENHVTKLTPVEFNPTANCPTWHSFLDKIMGGNTELIRFLQKAIGYSLTGSIREQCLFILSGQGANGKSTFLNTIQLMLADYAQQTPTETLMVKKNESIRNDIARLVGTRFVTAAESEQGKALAESLIKQMTGGDKLTARFLHGEYFEFDPKFKIFLATNHRPTIRGTDNGIWRRVRLIPFNVTIPENEQDQSLPMKLRAELPGILRWAVEGCLAWQRDGLNAPAIVNDATGEYRQEMDSLQAFIDECLIIKSGHKVLGTAVYSAYAEWCEESGEYPLSKRVLTIKLKEKGFITRKSASDGNAEWHGLTLKRPNPYSFPSQVPNFTDQLTLTDDNSGNLLQ